MAANNSFDARPFDPLDEENELDLYDYATHGHRDWLIDTLNRGVNSLFPPRNSQIVSAPDLSSSSFPQVAQDPSSANLLLLFCSSLQLMWS